MQGVFVFVLLGAFAVMSTLMVLLGAQMYHRTVEHTDLNNAERVLSAYVRSMVRAYDRTDAISVETHDGVVALAMRESFDGEVYVMRLYEYARQFEAEGGRGLFRFTAWLRKLRERRDGLLVQGQAGGEEQINPHPLAYLHRLADWHHVTPGSDSG